MWLCCYAQEIYQNRYPKMGFQLLVVVGSWASNYGSRIKSAQDTWSKDLVIVSIIRIAMVCYMNGLSYSTLAVSVRVRWTDTTRCCDLLGFIGLIFLPYPRGCVVNQLMSSESQFHLVVMVLKRNKPNRWESTASPNTLAYKKDISGI